MSDYNFALKSRNQRSGAEIEAVLVVLFLFVSRAALPKFGTIRAAETRQLQRSASIQTEE